MTSRRDLLTNSVKLIAGYGIASLATITRSSNAEAAPVISKADVSSKSAYVKKTNTAAKFSSSDKALVTGYLWASEKALSLVSRDDPVGDWYEAALPNRQAFCMRDTSHQSNGASVLGLSDVNKNMLTKFVRGISESRDWCSYWEIDRLDRPAPVDYKNDEDFWYNLPANFDIIDCCWRQYLWTGDIDYLYHPEFINFYQRSVTDHVKAWDRTGNGIMDSAENLSRRGIASYNEALNNLQTASDQIAYQALGYQAYAKILDVNNQYSAAEVLRAEATRLINIYNQDWWNEQDKNTYGALLRDGQKVTIDYHYGLSLGSYNNEHHLHMAIADLDRQPNPNVERFSHFAELKYRYSKTEQGYQDLLALTSPKLHRRDYPEVSFAAVGTYATGLMGIAPDARNRTITTRAQLTKQTDWAEMSQLRIFDNQITVKHMGNQQSTFINDIGDKVTWRAAFSGDFSQLIVNGTNQEAQHYFAEAGVKISYVDISVAQEQSVNVKVTS